jgi:hypothetical protein
MEETSLFTKGEKRESHNSQNEQSDTTELTKVIQTQQMFGNHHYGTIEAHRIRPDARPTKVQTRSRRPLEENEQQQPKIVNIDEIPSLEMIPVKSTPILEEIQ